MDPTEAEVDLNAARDEARFFFNRLVNRIDSPIATLRSIGIPKATRFLLEEWIKEMPEECKVNIVEGVWTTRPFQDSDLRFREAVLRFFLEMVKLHVQAVKVASDTH